MPLALQAKVLRLLHEQAFERIGGNETIRTDVRLIAATHRDLMAWSAEGKFRPDLYYRLNVFTIHLPPLRERGNDLVPLLVQALRAAAFSRELGRGRYAKVAPEALERPARLQFLAGQHVRELQSVLKQRNFLPGQKRLSSGPAPGLPARTRRESLAKPHRRRRHAGKNPARRRSSSANGSGPMPATCTRKRTARWIGCCCPASWEYTRGNQHGAALLLGIARQTLRLKLRDLGLSACQRPTDGDEDEPV